MKKNRSIFKIAARIFLAVIQLGVVAWCFGALWFDFPYRGMAHALAAFFLIAFIAEFFIPHGKRWIKWGIAGVTAILFGWWFSQKPSNHRYWQADVAEMPWAEIQGDTVTLHAVRHCDYTTEKDYTAHWETRVVNLSQIKGVDLAIDYWGSELIAHPIVSFQFEDGPPLAISIEARKEASESYSALGGLYRQYELIFIAADERDLFGVRTIYRQGEDLYLYHLNLSAEAARERFLEYVTSMNALRDQPRWYNAITTNCTTSIRSQHSAVKRASWDWRILLNGQMDHLLFEKGLIASDGLSFHELKLRALINTAAREAGKSPDFPSLIRKNRPGFTHADELN